MTLQELYSSDSCRTSARFALSLPRGVRRSDKQKACRRPQAAVACNEIPPTAPFPPAPSLPFIAQLCLQIARTVSQANGRQWSHWPKLSQLPDKRSLARSSIHLSAYLCGTVPFVRLSERAALPARTRLRSDPSLLQIACLVDFSLLVSPICVASTA